MEERNKLLRIYGPDLCIEEATAVINMTRMFSLSPLDDGEEEEDVITFLFVVVLFVCLFLLLLLNFIGFLLCF